MSGRSNRRARGEEPEHRSNPTNQPPNRPSNPRAAPTSRHAATVARMCYAMADIAQEVDFIDRAIAHALRGLNREVIRRSADRIAVALRLLDVELGRLLNRFEVEMEDAAADVAAARAGLVGPVVVVGSAGGGGGVAGVPASSSSSAGAGAAGGSGAVVAAVSAAGSVSAASGGRGLASSGVAGSPGAGSADGGSIGDASTAVASSDNESTLVGSSEDGSILIASFEHGPVGNDPMARGSPSATVGPIAIPRVNNPSHHNGYYRG